MSADEGGLLDGLERGENEIRIVDRPPQDREFSHVASFNLCNTLR